MLGANSSVANVFINFAGTPPTNEYGGTSFVTTALASTIEPLPMVMPGMIHACSPIQTLSSITTGPFEIKRRST